MQKICKNQIFFCIFAQNIEYLYILVENATLLGGDKGVMRKFSGLFSKDGEPILTQEYAQSLRDGDDRYNILAQAGGQEDCLACPAQFILYGGKRGSGKGTY